jgi:protein-S-isoprenylcysteine O-methyltransferase Ste14
MLSVEMSTPSRRSALPRLGRRGGGWVAVQGILIAAILLSAFAGGEWPDRLEPAADAAGALLLALGIGLLAGGSAALGRALTPFPAPRRAGELRTTGVYGRIRHPMYGGGILAALGWSAIFATLLGLALTAALALFAELKARREELWLEEEHPAYRDYRRRVPRRFIPFVW